MREGALYTVVYCSMALYYLVKLNMCFALKINLYVAQNCNFSIRVYYHSQVSNKRINTLIFDIFSKQIRLSGSVLTPIRAVLTSISTYLFGKNNRIDTFISTAKISCLDDSKGFQLIIPKRFISY